MACAASMLAFWQTLPSAMIAAAILGIGYGAYVSVDQALMTAQASSEENMGAGWRGALGAAMTASLLAFGSLLRSP